MPQTTDTAVPRSVAAILEDLLREEGYRPRREGDDGTTSALWFKAEGTRFVLFAYEDDPAYFRLGASFELGQGPHDVALLAELANRLNHDVKGVKVVLDPERNAVQFSVETFLTGPATPALLDRSLDVLHATANEFFASRAPAGRLDA